MRKILVIVVALLALSCTENQRVKSFGGNGTINLPAGQKLVNVTWKADNLWYITKPMSIKDSAEIYTFQEESSFGLIKGTYTIIEKK